MPHALYTMAAITSQDITMYHYTSEACNNFHFLTVRQTEFSSSVSPHMVDLVGEAFPQQPLPLLPPPKTINAVSSRRYFTSQIAHFREPKTPKFSWGTYLHFTQLPCLPWIKVSLFGRNSVDKSVIHLTWIHVVMASSHFRLIMIDNNLFGNYPQKFSIIAINHLPPSQVIHQLFLLISERI